jgi:signal transduction histidine kinase
MVHRVEAIDGHLWLDSPVGGPTTVEVTLPCE